MSDIVIRHAEPRDAEPLRMLMAHPEVYHDTLQIPYPAMEAWQEKLQPKPHTFHLVATLDDRVTGHLSLHVEPRPRRSHVATFGMAVSAGHQGRGIGSALILDGRPYPGSHFQSGEIGYSDYSSSEEYLEIDYSTLGILRRASALTGSQLDGFAFIQRIRDNDPCCLQLLEDWTAKLGRVLANNILMLDPDRVVIGGGISKQSDILIPLLEKQTNRQLPPQYRQLAEIVPARLANDAALFGAVKPFYETGADT